MPDPVITGVAGLLGLSDDPEPVREALRTVIDPELGVNLVDLGLVYDVAVNDGIAYITLTMTTPACPIGAFLEDQVRFAVLRLPGILGVEVEVVHEPRWSPALMSDAARKALGWPG
jgi:metal-sulfur cluster biosynthetic enzyme